MTVPRAGNDDGDPPGAGEEVEEMQWECEGGEIRSVIREEE